MSLLLSCITHGLPASIKRLGEPPPELKTSRRDVDMARDSWIAPSATAIAPGDPHPNYSGMIVDEVSVKGPFGMGTQQVWEYDLTSLGDSAGTKPTKTLNRGKRRTIEAGWDERTVRYLSWHASWKPCTGVASTNVITSTAHGYLNGQRVFFARLTGGAGIASQGFSSLGTGYYVINRTTDTFQISATVGGSAFDFTTDMSAGEVIAGEFALGAVHPTYPYMHLCELQVQDDNNDWATADCVYRGYEEAKPYHRMVTVNGQQFSASEPITVSLTGGWMDARHTNFHLPEIVVTDTYLAGSATLPSATVPSMSTPANAPAIASIVLTDDTDNLTYNYPYGWTVVATPTQATLNSQIAAMVYQIVYRYIHPVMFR